MSDFVVADASLAFKWLVEEDGSREAEALLQSWAHEGQRVAAPHLLLG